MRSILIALIFLPFCNTSSNIEGEWVNHEKMEWHFENNGDLTWLKEKDTILEFEYSYTPKHIHLVNSSSAISITFRHRLIDKNNMLIWGYKSNELSSHIDEVNLLKRKGIVSNLEFKHVSIFIVPDNLIGKTPIVYLENDSIKNPIYLSNGATYTNQYPDIEGFALRNYHFETPSGASLHTIYDLNDSSLHSDSVYVYVRGFNQSSRSVYNDFFQKDIQGNLLDVEIDTLKNLKSHF